MPPWCQLTVLSRGRSTRPLSMGIAGCVIPSVRPIGRSVNPPVSPDSARASFQQSCEGSSNLLAEDTGQWSEASAPSDRHLSHEEGQPIGASPVLLPRSPGNDDDGTSYRCDGSIGDRTIRDRHAHCRYFRCNTTCPRIGVDSTITPQYPVLCVLRAEVPPDTWLGRPGTRAGGRLGAAQAHPA